MMIQLFLGVAFEGIRENPLIIDSTTCSALLFLCAQNCNSLAPHDGPGYFDLLILHSALEDLKHVSDLTAQHHQHSHRCRMQIECSGNISAYKMLALSI
jgi:hypothetical protein